MTATLLSTSTLNGALVNFVHSGDLPTFFQGDATPADRLAEWAARLCYLSTARMGTAPAFIRARVNEGHEDVVEHGSATFRVVGQSWPLWAKFANRYSEVSPISLSGGRVASPIPWLFLGQRKDWLITGNMRVWLSLMRLGLAQSVLPTLKALAPAIFSEFDGEPVATCITQPWSVPGYQEGPLRVVLLGANVPATLSAPEQMAHGSATFLLEGLSRTATHQLVRHRSGSFSQESQRYVSLEKGGWHPITPPAIAADPEALAVTSEFYAAAEVAYAKLRSRGIRAEDARFLLPGAADSRLVVTMPFWGWRLYFEQREEKAAQWEIRAAAVAQHAQLHALAPGLF